MIKRVPVELIKFVLANKKQIKEFRTFLMLKMYAKSGVMTINSDEQKLVIEKLRISSKTFKRHIEELEKRYWIGIDEKRFFLRGWNFLSKQNEIDDFTTTVDIHYSYLTNKNVFKAYLMGSAISHEKKKACYKKRRESLKGCSKQARRSSKISLSLVFLSKKLGIPKASISDLKKLAVNHGFVVVSKNYEFTGIEIKHKDLVGYRKNRAKDSYPIRIDKELVLVKGDSFSSQLHLKRFRA